MKKEKRKKGPRGERELSGGKKNKMKKQGVGGAGGRAAFFPAVEILMSETTQQP